MPTDSEKTNLLGLDRKGLEAFFTDIGEKSFRAQQVMKWIHQKGVDQFAQMSNVSRALRERLAEVAEITPPTVAEQLESKDGTVKWRMKLACGNSVETVYIPEPERATLCISSQVGCQLNCSFCSTGRQGFNRNLTTDEIIGQIWLANKLLPAKYNYHRAVTNVVMMGMGEPLLNFPALAPALNIMLDDLAYGLSKRRVTVSTAGLVPGIDKLRQTVPVALAISLHAPNDALRNQLVPLNKKYPIKQLMDACHRYLELDAARRITVEYTLIAGINDSPALAIELAELVSDLPCKVNLIPFNPFPGSGYSKPTASTMRDFQKILMDRGIMTMTRKTRGDDIYAACGQLSGEVLPRTVRKIASPAVTNLTSARL